MLSKAKKQELFDHIGTHLLLQGKESVKGRGLSEECAYRGEMGLQCAVGCLIPDSIYDPQLEGRDAVLLLEAAPELVDHLGVPPSGRAELGRFLRELQILHDGHPPAAWFDELWRFAKRKGLSTDLLEVVQWAKQPTVFSMPGAK